MKVHKIKHVGLFLLCLSVHMICGQYCNEVISVLHDNRVFVDKKEKSAEQSSGHITLGTVIFYFSKKPIVSFVPERGQDVDKTQKVFIFPKTTVKNSYCKSSIREVNNTFGKGYSMKIEQIKLPIDGVKVSILYNPKIVDFNYKIFESVADKKGVVFNFYNKKLIDKIKSKDDNVLCIA